MRRAMRVFVGALAGGAAVLSMATPPARDTVVAQRLVPRDIKASLRRQAESVPQLTSAQRLHAARRMIEAARADGDPRTLGYAEAMLSAWPAHRNDAPVDALVLRAIIEGRRHRFDAARALLDRVLARTPQHAQALLTRATIALVAGDYAGARADCTQLQPLAADASALCGASVDAMTGANARALATARRAADRTEGSLRAWALTLQAQVLEAGDDAPAAALRYRAALSTADDLWVRLAYVDLLITAGNAGEAMRLLGGAPETDGVLLRQWLLARRLGNAPQAAGLQARLQARMDAAAARGGLQHAREAAWFALERGDAHRALSLARENWRSQRETTDLLLLARAARAAGDDAAVRELRQWVARVGLIDERVAREMRLRPLRPAPGGGSGQG